MPLQVIQNVSDIGRFIPARLFHNHLPLNASHFHVRRSHYLQTLSAFARSNLPLLLFPRHVFFVSCTPFRNLGGGLSNQHDEVERQENAEKLELKK
jgi:hypothetical protein